MNTDNDKSIFPQMTFNMNLKTFNTFGLDSISEFAYQISSAEQLPTLMKFIQENNLRWRVLGGGNNVVLPRFLPGVTLLIKILGKDILESNEKYTILAVGAGVEWNEFVIWTLEQGLNGLENLAMIPGTVGAAPIQNIGAYGVEVVEFIDNIAAFDTTSNTFVNLQKQECQFAYRDSYFKQNPSRFIITKVVFEIPEAWNPRLKYPDLAKQIANNSTTPKPKEIFAAVCNIRMRKLPDPKVIANVGSFFKNPIIPYEQFELLRRRYPNLASYAETAGKRKISAGWLIEQCGFKGKRMGSVGIYEHHALVLVNYGGATLENIIRLTQCIQDKVRQEFGVNLDIEPVFL